MNADGSGLRSLTRERGLDTFPVLGPVLSPNRKRILFESRREGLPYAVACSIDQHDASASRRVRYVWMGPHSSRTRGSPGEGPHPYLIAGVPGGLSESATTGSRS